MTTITFHDISQYPAPDPNGVIHFKGFATRLNLRNSDYINLTERLLQHLVLANPKYLCWDGDHYNNRSFTYVIPEIQKRLPDLKLIAILKTKTQEDFDKSWQTCPYQINITAYTIGGDFSWKELGIRAIKVTKATKVFCLGGGRTVQLEYEAAGSNVSFEVYAMQRTNTSKQWEDTEMLQYLNNSNVVVHWPYPNEIKNTTGTRDTVVACAACLVVGFFLGHRFRI